MLGELTQENHGFAKTIRGGPVSVRAIVVSEELLERHFLPGPSHVVDTIPGNGLA